MPYATETMNPRGRLTRALGRRSSWAVLVALAALGLSLAGACKSGLPFSSGSEEDTEGSASCPPSKPAPVILPGVKPEHRQAGYWIDRAIAPDQVVMSVDDIAHHDAAFAALAERQPNEDPLTHEDLLAPERPERLGHELTERLAFMRERIDRGEYVAARGEPLSAEVRALFAEPREAPSPIGELRVVVEPTPLRCGPLAAPIYKGPEIDPRFDRNSCSMLRAQEPVKVLARWPAGADAMMLVRSRYALGWIATDAALSPPVPAEHAAAFANGPRLRVHGSVTLTGGGGARLEVADKTFVATTGAQRALFATKDGFDVSGPLANDVARSAARPLTRRALFEEAFAYLETPYGWGDQQGGRDCSRFLMDVLAAFGLHLPRHSGAMVKAGSMRADIGKLRTADDRLAVIDAAAERGVVLLHFPGHIMLYLGRSREGAPMVLHAFAEYLERCEPPSVADAGRAETLRTVDRVQVSDLSLGAGTSRGAFLDRITHVTVLGGPPGPELMGIVERRPPAPATRLPEGDACKDSAGVATFVSPEQPHPGQPLRIVVTSARDLGSVELVLRSPDGKRHMPDLHRLGGPPYGYWGEIASPSAGGWTAQLGEGERVEACRSLAVAERGPPIRGAGGTVWVPRRRWTPDTESLFSTFVEQLFDHPLDDRTWPRLQELLDDQTHNILFGHRGQNEEQALAFEPDCADLPYFLRAYFAWKLRLPFAYRHCNRGKPGVAPYCDREVKDALGNPEATGEVAAFAEFMRTQLADGVHSGSGRTAPGDDHTDYYPVPLTREAIRPGTMFADPYGHLFVIADWIAQGTEGYGVLVGADAQPDGTVGRRRFWRGSFLFTPETTEAGAGFKAFRPVRYRGGRMEQLTNTELGAESGMVPFSLEQYQGTKDDFYDRVDALINPRPLDATESLDALIDALHEQVTRRVGSVENGEQHKAKGSQTIDMPNGHAIFETTGAWEDFSTPARDMRLLIAMDTVSGFAEVVRRRPERYGLVAGAQLERVLQELGRHLDAQLAKRSMEYRRSDGSPFKLTLADVIARASLFEMAYNPNDCVEIRWAAAEGSEERSRCKRHAPAHQRTRMTEYRRWFAERKRPPR